MGRRGPQPGTVKYRKRVRVKARTRKELEEIQALRESLLGILLSIEESSVHGLPVVSAFLWKAEAELADAIERGIT